MKQGIALQELAVEVDRQRDNKRDFVADTRRLFIDNSPENGERGWAGNLALHVLPKDADPEFFGINDTMHRQLGRRLKIPAQYYQRMLDEAPDLLAENLNHWFLNAPQVRMVRTLDGNGRAFLSDRYRPLDNCDLIEAVLPAISESGAKVYSCNVTPERLYLKAVLESVQVRVPRSAAYPGGLAITLSPGIVVSNSEIGLGTVKVQPATYTLDCQNMTTWAEKLLRKIHSGSSLYTGGGDGDDGDASQYLSDETKRLKDAATWSEVADVARSALTGDLFDDLVKKVKTACGQELAPNADVPVPDVVERVGKRFELSEDETGGVLRHLIDGGDMSRWGLSSAITRFSQDVEDYVRATDLEGFGGDIIALEPVDWRALVN